MQPSRAQGAGWLTFDSLKRHLEIRFPGAFGSSPPGRQFGAAEDAGDLAAQLAQREGRANKLHVPLACTGLLYNLRRDIQNEIPPSWLAGASQIENPFGMDWESCSGCSVGVTLGGGYPILSQGFVRERADYSGKARATS